MKRKIKRKSWLEKAVGGLVCLACALPIGCKTIESVSPDNKPVEGYAETTFASNYMGNGGFVVGKGPVNQNLLVLSKPDNLVKGDSISAGSWMNYDFGDGELVETDFFGEYTFPVNFMENIMRYSDESYGDKVLVGFQHWNYPGKTIGSIKNHDNVFNAKWIHNSTVDLEVNYLHFFPDKDTNKGDLLTFKISKKLPLGKRKIIPSGIGVSLTPSLSYSYAPEIWFGLKGFTDITHGLEFNIDGLPFDASVDLKYQSGLQEDVEDQGYIGVRIGKGF